MKINYLLLTVPFLCLRPAQAQENVTYQIPPKEIVELVEADNTPTVMVASEGNTMLLLDRPDYMSIEEASQPVIGLAGLRINSNNNTVVGTATYTGIKIKNINGEVAKTIVGLPQSLRAFDIKFNKDASKFSFLNAGTSSVELWVVDVATSKARQIEGVKVNAIQGPSYIWKNDGHSLLVMSLPDDRGQIPTSSIVPAGPIVQDNAGVAAPARTYQNLLKDKDDIRLFEYFLTSQLKEVELSGNVKSIGLPAIYRSFSISPDNNYLLTFEIVKPYSFLVPISGFAYEVKVRDPKGQLIQKVYNSALAESVPLGFDSTIPGKRSFNWRADEEATLYWVEALDQGDSRKQVEYRDVLMTLKAPFQGEPKAYFKTKRRFAGISWSEKGYAIVSERWRATREQKATLINSADGKLIKEILDRSSEDTYTDPGRFVMHKNKYDRSVLLLADQNEPTVFTIAGGASEFGDQPFLMKWNLISGAKDTLFRSNPPYYEMPIFFNNTGKLILSRESNDEVPNYYALDLKTKNFQPLTNFENPYPSLDGVRKNQVEYRREDGLSLSGTLYLPKDYKEGDGPLPLLMWAYPREFKTATAAGRVKGSPHRFVRLSWGSPIYWVNRGYAVLDNADMPIVGEGEAEPNDTFVEQLEQNARAAIDFLVEKGVADRNRVAVGGHSYGAFMTANLLAHTDLFAAGLARSGAYNRTFTPFGFQAEERTYWQAPEVYYRMSPFSYADKIKAPLLLVHGMDDENSGTFPIQSERLYNAIKGHGGTTRLVMLPKEFHGYRAKESILHTLWEMDRWLEIHVKNKK